MHESFDLSDPPSPLWWRTVDTSSLFTAEQANEYYTRLIAKRRTGNDVETEIEGGHAAWEFLSADQLAIGEELKIPEEIRKLEERDDPQRVWKNSELTKKFIRQKIKNILEFQALCQQFK